MKHLDPKNDVVFKKIFGQHKHLLISLLNDLLMLDDRECIETVEYLSPEQVPDVLDLKNSTVDVKCIDQEGRTFIVEMQMLWTESFKQRVLFNASKAYVSQLGKGYQYSNLYPVYSLNILNENYHADKEQFYHRYSIVEHANTHEKIEGLEFVFIVLPKFLKHPNAMRSSLRKPWLTLLTISESSDIPEELNQDPLTKEALKLIEESYYTLGEKEAYDKYWDAVSSIRTLYDEAHRKALVEGLKQGRAEARLELARKMLTQSMSIELIATVTELSEQEIQALAS